MAPRCLLVPIMVVAALSAPVTHSSAQVAPYRDARLPTDARVRDLLGRMTLEEKFWQLFMIPGDLDDPAHDYSHGVFGLQISRQRRAAQRRRDRGTRHAERINAIQRYFVQQTRLGIPIIPFEEALHGLTMPEGATMFPQAIALAATWDPRSSARVADAIARETREPRHPSGALAGHQHRRRRALGTRRGDLRRRSVPRVGDGARVRRAVRTRRRRRHAQALRRQRRRGRPRQLSDRSQRTHADRAVLPAVRRGDTRGRRARS